MFVLLYVTSGGVNVYEKYLFSAHMIAHMVLTMAVPVLLVPSAPLTLALRAIRKRDDGTRGAREWILLAVHSRPFEIVASPLVAAVLFAASLWIFYYTPIFSWATTDHVGHEWMTFHFLVVGYLFVSSLIGVDPGPARPPYPIRLVILLATLAFHAFFGLALITSTGLLSASWYGAMGWGPSIPALQDQQTAGGIAWGIGDIPALALAILVVFMWSRSDERDTKRYDRKAERDGDAELNAYNDMLAKRAKRG
jgi:putative copper resistance protein D